MHIDLVV